MSQNTASVRGKREEVVMKERLIVTVDSSIGDIVEFEKKGGELVFSAKKGQFKVLTESDVAQLSAKSRQKYSLTKELYEENLIDEPVAGIASVIGAQDPAALINTGYGIKLNAEAGSASDRLKFRVTDGRDKKDFFYAQAENVEEQLYQGAEVVTNGVQSWGNKGTGVHRLTKRGNDELILMYKKGKVEKEAAEIEKRYQERTQGAFAEHDELVAKTAGTKFKDRRDSDFTDISKD